MNNPQQHTITDEMIAAAYKRIEDDRPGMRPALKARLQAKGLQHEVPPDPKVVIMCDDLQHTVAFPICDDPTCICHALEYEQAVAERAKPKRQKRTYIAPKPPVGIDANKFNNGSQGFSLLR